MLTFGIIAEGPTDQTVIENIILGYFQKEVEEPVINYIHPLNRNSPGGWTRVFRSLRQGDPQKALQTNNYLIIQIDTDKQDDKGFDVSRQEGGTELSVPARVDRVIARLKKDINSEFYQANEHRILFAVSVDSIECWLLPLLYDDNKAEKTTGCLDAANRELRRRERKVLEGNDKFIDAYKAASNGYSKRKVLMEHRDRNPSLGLFIKQLDALQSRPTANDPGTSPGDDKAAPEGEKPSESPEDDPQASPG